MPVICPTVTAHTPKEYKKQLDKIAHVAHRIQIDLTDGIFAGPITVEPEDAWWPAGVKADIHLMYDKPLNAIKALIDHEPNLVIIHAEANGQFDKVVELCRSKKIKLGVALLPKTQPHVIFPALHSIDHVLIFSGNLGHQGGAHFDLGLLSKVSQLREKKPNLEIGWDGGIDQQNISQLVFGGIDVLNVGSYIQEADDPVRAYHRLERIAEETGTT